MIIDCHGHYTTAPKELSVDPLIQHLKGEINITDEQLKESIINNQLRLQNERGTDLTIFSPRASKMEHHIGNLSTSIAWS